MKPNPKIPNSKTIRNALGYGFVQWETILRIEAKLDLILKKLEDFEK